MNTEPSCSQCRHALVELTAGILAPTARQAVERHLASCPSCQRERDNWLALGDAIRESGRRLLPDRGFASGLVRLRAALAFQTDDFATPEGGSPPMEPDPQSTGTHTSATLPDTAHPSAASVSRRRPYPAIAATLAFVLVSALVFGTFTSRLHFGSGNTAPPTATPTPTTTPTPISATNIAVQTVPPLPNSASVVSISMVSASDGWAVASVDSGSISNAILLHYSNGRWTPSGDIFPDIYLTDISMDSHDDGWAVGAHSDQVTGVVLHYSGGRWSQVQAPNLRFAGSRVWAFSPSQALVLATLPKDKTGKLGSALERYDNGTWTDTASPRGISGMTLLSVDDFWATCWDGHILHYLRGQWTAFTINGQSQTPGQGGQPLSISMLYESNGWVSGFTNANPQGIFLAHFDGHTWTRVAGPAASAPTDINTIAMLSPEEAWAGGDVQTLTGQTVLLHYVQGQWQAVPASYSGSIGKIVMVSPTEGWATVGGGSTAGLLHYQDGRWTPYNPNA